MKIISQHKPLQNRIALISGGAGDIGAAVAHELARLGASIALGDLKPASETKTLVRSLQKLGVVAHYHRVDVADDAAVSAWVQHIVREIGTPTIIIPNAGIDLREPLRTITPQQWRKIMSVNLDGAMFVARAGANAMINKKKSGHIVFIGSIAAHFPSAAIPAYCISKSAVRMLMQCMAVELAEHDIRVNEVAPGNVDGGLSGKVLAKNPKLTAAVLRTTPLKMLVPLSDVAQQVAFLCDPRNRSFTGSTFVVDAGYSLLGGAKK